ncbi:ATP-dependent DNA helicase DinG [Schinkia sp. CFF1]
MNRFMVIDVETTGNKIGTDKIIQIGAILIEDGEIIERFSSFVNPNMKLSTFIKQFTGIEDEALKRAPSFALIAPMLLEMLEGSYFVAHNVPFDLSFIKAELEAGGFTFDEYPTLDTVELSRLLFPSLNSYKLSQLARTFAIDHDQPHRADSDAEATAHLLLNLLEKLNSLPLLTLKRLEDLAPHFQSSLGNLIQEMIKAKKLALQIEDEGFDIYRGLAFKPHEKKSRIDHDDVKFKPFDSREILANLQRVDSKFEIREGQMEMIDCINDAFDHHVHGLIEAGTGTGKTLGYLIPALFFAKQSGKRVVISTFTTHLQEQIMNQEINIMQKALPFSFDVTVLKGRNHYLCLRRFEDSLENTVSDTYDTVFTKAQILVWLTETTTGDVDELNLTSGGRIFWNKLQCDTECSRNKECPWYSRCYYFQKRKEAENADLIITNHALLLSDIKSNYSLLPDYDELVIDEAHHLDDVAREHFGIQLDYFAIQTLLNQIGLINGTELLHRIGSIVNVDHSLALKISAIEEQYVAAKMIIDDLFRSIRSYVLSKNTNNKNEIGRLTYRFHVSKEDGPLWKVVKNNAFVAIEKLEDLKDGLASIYDELQIKEVKKVIAESGILKDVNSLKHSLEEMTTSLCKLLFESEANKVTWLEIEAKGAQNSAYLFSQHIDISESLAVRLFSKKQSVILTSATLAVEDSFQYVKTSLGLLDFEVIAKKIPSPFSYKDQVKLMLPSDVPPIKDVEQAVFVEDIAQKIISIARVTKGRMLILFTSYEMLEKTFYTVKAASKSEGFVLIGQGISSGSRAKLTKNFKQHDQAILFGTSSFWEGIDIPGEDLSCIVIVRLPFSPPDDCMMAAKAEAMKKSGRNAFMELFLPQAILRFKQGFGRLIRAENDHGAVFVLDRRITTKGYGKKFIQALPPLEIYEEETEDLLKKLQDWL